MKKTILLPMLIFSLAAPTTKADTFGSGANTFEIEFVNIGNPGNLADTTGNPNPAGSVDYNYRIGKFEISEGIINKANAITQAEGNPLGITHVNWGENKPATAVSWFEAAQFVNWLNTSEGLSPAYKFDNDGSFQLWQLGDPGYDPENLFRNRQAFYFLPSTDEWYKAAYHDPIAEIYYDYPTGSDLPPLLGRGTEPNTAVHGISDNIPPADIMLAGGLSPYGTMAQGGNASELLETASDSPAALREYRGGDWGISVFFMRSTTQSFPISPSSSSNGFTGFRVASIPEPSTMLLAALVVAGLSLKLRRCRRFL